VATKSTQLVLDSEGSLARLVGEWSEEKLHYVRRYCQIFNAGMYKKWPIRVYIDLFSGPGRCVIRETGAEIDASPLIAAKTEPPFTHLICNDLDDGAVESLRRRLTGITSSAVHCLQADCNVAVDHIVRYLDTLPRHLSLCFIDPTNWQITFDSVARLTADRKMDLILVFMSASMKRVGHLQDRRLTAFFGDDHEHPEWCRVYQEAQHEHRAVRALLDHYCERLRSIGYTEFHDAVSILTTNNLPFYQMLFASKNSRGQDFWRKIAARQHDGQLRLAL
jgi:three-Cys-motif partner protein